MCLCIVNIEYYIVSSHTISGREGDREKEATIERALSRTAIHTNVNFIFMEVAISTAIYMLASLHTVCNVFIYVVNQIYERLFECVCVRACVILHIMYVCLSFSIFSCSIHAM